MNSLFKRLSAFTLLLVCTSCSLLLKQAYDEDKNRIKLLPQETPPLYCEYKKSSIELFGPAQKNQRNFLHFLKKGKETFTPSERFALWVLLHTKLRPDKVSVYSQARLFEYQQKILTYREYKTEKTPLLNALGDFLARNSSKWTVSKLATYLEKNYNFPLLVDEGLENFLEKNKDLLWAKNELRDPLFKDNQILKAGESLPAFQAGPLVAEKKTPLPDVKEILSGRSSYFCDFDPSIYKDQPRQVIPIPEKLETPLTLGLTQGDQSFFIAVDQNFEIKEKDALYTDPYFKLPLGLPKRLASFCAFNLERGNLLFVAYNERDPGQLLTNLIRQIGQKLATKDEVAQILSTPRRLVLHHPTRIILEADAERLSQKRDHELEELFKGNYPIYQSKGLGQIDALLIGTQMGQNGFIKDKRSQYSISCQEN